MKLLEAPLLTDQLSRQPVEQSRVRRPAAIEAKVIRRVDQANAEMIVPEAVDDDSGSQRIAGIGDPFGQAGAPRCFGSIFGQSEIGRQCGQGSNPAWRHGLTRSCGVSAIQNMSYFGL